MVLKTNQDLLMEYMQYSSKIEQALDSLKSLKKQAADLEKSIINNKELLDVLCSTGVRTYDEKFVYVEDAKIQVSDYQPIPYVWEINND